MPKHYLLAFDLGAENGRAVLGRLANRRLTLKEIGRFPNGMVNILSHQHWNTFRLYEEMRRCLKACANEISQYKGADRGKIESIGIDTWGVDFALLDRQGNSLGLPYAYRDSRTKGMMKEFFKLVPRERIYQLTGIQFFAI